MSYALLAAALISSLSTPHMNINPKTTLNHTAQSQYSTECKVQNSLDFKINSTPPNKLIQAVDCANDWNGYFSVQTCNDNCQTDYQHELDQCGSLMGWAVQECSMRAQQKYQYCVNGCPYCIS